MLFLHTIACLKAVYAEKGYYLRVKGLLLIGDIITTYGQKGYYLLVVLVISLIFVFLGWCFTLKEV